MKNKQWVDNFINSTKDKWIETSDYIWEHPEIRFNEHKSVAFLTKRLHSEGFSIQKNIAKMDTAFIAEYGSGFPVIALLGEYDALANLSQKSGVASQIPITSGSNGHGCGHNLLGTGALAAAVALKNYLQENELKGTIRFYGCPAEEGGSGKTFMAREGVFDDVDLALTWHPAPISTVMNVSTLANIQAYIRFKGRSSHAAAAPHLGRSALDAIELTNVGINYLREHVIPEARMHYAVTNTGGLSPNVVQAEAEALYLIRAPEVDQCVDIFERVKKIAKGASLMTETDVEIIFDKACSNFIPNHTLNNVLEKSLVDLGGPAYTEEDEAYAYEIQATLTKRELENSLMGVKGLNIEIDKPLFNKIIPAPKENVVMPGSTDVGDVSWITPTAQCSMATAAVGTPLHTWQFVAQGKSAYAHNGMLQVAKVLALTAIRAIEDHSIIETAKADLTSQLGNKKYISPIPSDIEPTMIRK